MLELEAITPENYPEVLDLGVADDQAHLIAPVTRSLADALVWGAEIRAARSGAVLVGFVMVYPFELSGVPVVNIVRFLVDRRHQGRGLGRALLSATLRWIGGFAPPPQRVRVATLPENERALRLYRSAGFEGSAIEEGEVVLWRDVT